MGLSITGYVLEPPRVGASNSPFTLTPNNYISDQGDFDAAYPSDESAPRTEYHVFVLNDYTLPGTGPGVTRSFADARFAWTKNEVIQRFDYLGRDGRFKTIPGAALIEAGTLALDSNTNRIQVAKPLSSNLSLYPVRVSVGTGSGTTFTCTVVLNDGAFTTPAAGTVQLSLDTGNLNWRPSDLTSFAGQSVRFQRQTFYTFDESTGNLGVIDDPLLLNPLPATGQYPLIRIGFSEYLTPVQRANEGSFSANPTAGTVEWALDTGRLKFRASAVTANSGRNVYYDGVAFGHNIGLKITNLGTVNTPGTLSPVPPEASDLFFRVVNVVQFAQTQYVDALTSPGKKGIVQIRRSTGAVRFSDADKALYGSSSVQAVVPDLDIERGMTLRLFRTPVNLDDADSTLKDVSAYYDSDGAVLADPIIGAPSVPLPAVPVDTLPIDIEVSQGTGTFVGTLPRLDVPTPPTGLGYVIDFEARELVYAQRKDLQVIDAPTPYGGVQLPDPLLFSSNLSLELETSPSSGTYASLTIGEDALVDLQSGLVTLVETDGTLEVEGTGGSFLGTTFTDASKNFTTLGVVPGDYLVVTGGTAKGVYIVDVVGTTTLTTDVAGATSSNLSYEIRRGVEVLADRFFYDVPPVDPNTRVERINALGAITNSPRLTVDPTATLRFRFGKTTFSTNTVSVANDAAFTPPASLAQGTVEVSLDTGHVNFSQTDVTAGGIVYGSRTLALGVDYTVQAPLGFVQFSERMLESEEAFVTYKNADGDVVQERVTFLVSKERTADHPAPTDVLTFNPLGREVASIPSPKAFRGGRPQSSTQVVFDVSASSVTFVGAPTVTDALPSGPVVGPTENVYVDYYVYEAIGGEQNFTVLQPPMQGVTIILTEESPSFQLAGDRTGIFLPNLLLLVNRSETYLIASSSYDSGSDLTTVTLALGQQFQSDQQNPTLSLSSGPVRVTGTPSAPSYFVTEMASYDPVPRGMNKFRIAGDLSRTYVSGTIVLFTNGTYTDLNTVAGSAYDEASGKTEITLIGNGLRQYSGVTLRRSVRPVLAVPSASANTLNSPELAQPYLVFRKIEGQVGEILTQPDQYKIDQAGVVTLSDPLVLNEEIGIFYTGDLIVEAGRRFRASYTFAIVPSEANGLLNQILTMSYTTYLPDTFFWRVETFTNFRGELVESYEQAAKSSVPTGGPVLENSSSPNLFEQGRESVFFQEGYLANEDLVARPTLKYFNDIINDLEDVLQSMDGRVVGDHDGRFLFDGNIDNPARTTFASVTNQIDDRFKISPAPYTITGPPFVATSVGTFVEVYKAAATSRFYPTFSRRFGVVVAGTNTGDPIMEIGVQNLRSIDNVQRRYPWAVTTALALAGATTLAVDDANGNSTLVRPAFIVGMKVAIVAQDGTVLVPDGASLNVNSVSATSIGLDAVPVDIPVGATIRLATDDVMYLKYYRLGVDLNVDLEKGLLTYIAPASSLLAWAGLTQTPSPPAAGEALDVEAYYNSTLTAPYRFPALDGGTTDDDGNRQFPVLTPWTGSEISPTGYLTTEKRIIQTSTGTLRTATSTPFVGIGSLDGTGTIITNAGGPWPGPVPKVFDLVDIRTGPNGPSTYRRITAVGGSTITVATAFAVPGVSGFQFTVTTSTSLETGTAGVGSTSSFLSDASANFSSVRPGHTMVVTTGAVAGQRRQVLNVLSPTTLQMSAFTSTVLGSNYRIDNPLQTFGSAPNSITVAELVPALDGQISVLGDEVSAIDGFFDNAFIDVATGSNGQTNTSTFTSVGQTFIDDEVNTSHLLFIRNGSNAQFYKIQSVDSQTSLTIEGTFPVNTTGITFRIVSSIGLTEDPLNGVLTAALNAETYVTQVSTFKALVTTQITVALDAGAFATRLVETDLDLRETQVDARLTQVPTDIIGIESELSAGDKLYDTRYVWIDARINLENGILPMKDRAVTQRLKAQAEVINQLTKLLSVQKA